MNKRCLPQNFILALVFALLGIGTAFGQLKADFTYSTASGCSPLVVFFRDTSTGPVKKYLWRFGNGNQSALKDPGATYFSKGKFSVTLVIFDASGNADSITKTSIIDVHSPPSPDFSANQTNQCTASPISFTDLTPKGSHIASWLWDFGDGSTSSQQNPSHTFGKGKFTVTLEVTDSFGCSNSIIKGSYINVGGNLQVGFTANINSSCSPPLAVTFTGNTSGTSGKVNYAWDFGDGNTSTSQSPSHTYTAYGNYTVSFSATDATGCTGTEKVAAFISIQKVVASFKAVPSSGCTPLTVTFVPGAQTNCNGCQYSWDFGDGSGVSSSNNPSYQYNNPGKYNVYFKITNNGTCHDSILVKNAVIVDSVPTIDSISPPSQKACTPPLSVNFKGYTKNASSWFWDFGDGNTSALQNPVHKYTNSGVFDISLTAANASGCSATKTLSSAIAIQSPTPIILSDPGTMGCIPFHVKFTGILPGFRATSWNWSFGDSLSPHMGPSTSTDSTPSHVYIDTGSYWVVLAIKGPGGCIGKDSVKIMAGKKPHAAFTASPANACVKELVSFINTSNNDSIKADHFFWGFGDLGTGSSSMSDSLNPNVAHAYKAIGQYTVSLIAESQGCEDTLILKNYVKVNPPIAFFSFTPDVCTPTYIDFSDSSVGATSWLWDFGDGTTSTLQNPGHNFSLGQHSVSETAKNGPSGCTNTFDSAITVSASSGFDFSTSIFATCTSRQFTFTPYFNNAQISSGYKIHWDFGDGVTSDSPVTGHVYKDTGNFAIKLIVKKNAGGCTDTVVHYQRLYATNTKALFTASATKLGCPPQLVNFYDESVSLVNQIISWKWYFGDGSTSTLQNPSKVYEKAGKFNVALKVTDLQDCIDSLMVPHYITISGATGDYTVDTTKGCDSVTVHFRVINSNAAKFDWDMADGTIINDTNFFYTYRPSKISNIYIPRLFLTDSSGICKYALPAKDTITVLPGPDAGFYYDTSCAGGNTVFHDSSQSAFGPIVNWSWNFGDGSSSTLQNPLHAFATGGAHTVHLTVHAVGGCPSTAIKQIWVKKLAVGFYASPSFVCMNDPVNFTDTTLSEIPVAYRIWDFGDKGSPNDSSTLANPSHLYSAPGLYTVREIVANTRGCTDTLVKTGYVSVADTATPAPVIINGVTVATQRFIQISFEKFNNPGFSEYLIYKKDNSGQYHVIDSVSNVNQAFYRDSNVDVYKQSYCYKVVIKTACNKFSSLNNTIENCSIKLTATGDTDKIYLSWNAYVGWTSVKNYTIYRSKMDDSTTYSYLQTVFPPQLSFTDTTTFCLGRYYYYIQALSPVNFPSISNISSAIPIHINRLPANKLASASVVNDKNIFVAWDAAPAGIPASAYVLEKSEDGIKYSFISAFHTDTLSYLDTNVNVNLEPYYYHTRIIDSCGDTGKVSNIGKTILLNVDTSGIELLPQLHWTKYIYWPEGVQYYTIFRKAVSGNYTPIDSTASGNDTAYTDTVTDLNSLPFYCYHVVAHRSFAIDTSVSNDGCLKHEKSYIYVPNAFTPNHDGINDRFGAKGMYITQYVLRVYNRWGELVFESISMANTWDGTFHGRECPLDSYIWTISATGLDDKPHFLYGSVKLIK